MEMLFDDRRCGRACGVCNYLYCDYGRQLGVCDYYGAFGRRHVYAHAGRNFLYLHF